MTKEITVRVRTLTLVCFIAWGVALATGIAASTEHHWTILVMWAVLCSAAAASLTVVVWMKHHVLTVERAFELGVRFAEDQHAAERQRVVNVAKLPIREPHHN